MRAILKAHGGLDAIAERVPCSGPVVSRVINRKRGVSPQLTERVWRVIEAVTGENEDAA